MSLLPPSMSTEPSSHPSLEYHTQTIEAIREQGQDCAVACHAKDTLSIRVADGAGGVAGSARAARIVCKKDPISASKRTLFMPLDEWMRSTNLHICEFSRIGPPCGMASAVVINISDDGWIQGASVGDCKAWIFDLDGLPAIELTSGQHRKPLLGEDDAEPVSFEGELRNRMLVVATDGLWKYANLPSCAATMRLAISNPLFPLETLADALIDSARLPTGALQDDVGLAIVRRK